MKLEKDKLVERLREMLREKNLSPYQAGRIMEIEPRTLYRWLGYERRPGSKLYRKALKKGLKRLKKL